MYNVITQTSCVNLQLNCNKQAIPICLAAAGLAKIYAAANWNRDILDEVLRLGDELFAKTMSEIEKHPELYAETENSQEVREDEEDAGEMENEVISITLTHFFGKQFVTFLELWK